MEDSIFTKIIKGELPSYKIYEDEKTIVIVPLHPIAKAHVLAIPKVQVDNFYDLDDADYQALMMTVKKIAQYMAGKVPAKRVGTQIVGLDVPHVHVHIIAFDTNEEFHYIADESVEPDTPKREALFNLLKMEPGSV